MMDTKKFKVNEPKVVHDTMDGEVILIHMDSGNYYSIDPVGADIWDLIKSGRTMQQIIDNFYLRYEGGAEEVSNNLVTFIEQLIKEELVIADTIIGLTEDESPAGDAVLQEKIPFTAPKLEIYSDMQDLLLLDPIHEVDAQGWPNAEKS